LTIIPIPPKLIAKIIFDRRREEQKMDEKNKNVDKSSWIIGGMTLVGVGVGFVFLQTSALFFVASILIGIGLGIVIASIVSSRNA
jgi:F0F1-type ATP synthase assembly protein I